MKKETLKEISRTLDYDSSIATIKLLLASSQEYFIDILPQLKQGDS